MNSNEHRITSDEAPEAFRGGFVDDAEGHAFRGSLIGEDGAESDSDGHAFRHLMDEDATQDSDGHTLKSHLIELDEPAEDTEGHSASGRF